MKMDRTGRIQYKVWSSSLRDFFSDEFDIR